MRAVCSILTVGIAMLLASCSNRTAPANALCFFAVSEKPVAGGRYIDTSDFPKLGYISNTPDYVLASLKEVSTNDVTSISIVDRQIVETNTTAAVSITMFPAEGRSFAIFTRQNIDQKVLLMLRDKPLIAPMVRAPIATGSLELPSLPKSVVEDIQRLVRHE